jgi:alpha,alpha-trehalase
MVRFRGMQRTFVLALLSFATLQAFGQQATSYKDTGSYIQQAWSILTRSNSRCETFENRMIAVRPTVYISQTEDREKVAKELAACKVDVHRLPKRIEEIGEFDATKLPSPGLLYLPHPYVVPGGMFNEMYGWDSYFIIRGLLVDGKNDLAKDMVENFFYEIENYGGVLNANRTYYLSRSQPPFLTSMIRSLYSAGVVDKTWLAMAYKYAVRDYSLWQRPEHRAGDTGLARYFDYGTGPVPEMGSDDSYYVGVAQQSLEDKNRDGYVVPVQGAPSKEDYTIKVCAQASGRCAPPAAIKLTDDYFSGDRAMRESGFDVSFRFGPYSGRTQHFAPVCLNALLFKEEKDLAWMAAELGLTADAAKWERSAKLRGDLINKYLWNPTVGAYFDYDTEAKRQSNYFYATTYYPLWAGVASPEQARGVLHTFARLNRSGGLMMSDFVSGAQWDDPYGWAPIQLLAAEGLDRYGFHAEADEVAHEFTNMIDESFRREGTIHEKYNVESRSANVTITAGYTQNVVGFGWTNGVYLVLDNLHRKLGSGSNAQHAP